MQQQEIKIEDEVKELQKIKIDIFAIIRAGQALYGIKHNDYKRYQFNFQFPNFTSLIYLISVKDAVGGSGGSILN